MHDELTEYDRAGLASSGGKENAGAGEAGGLMNTTDLPPDGYKAKYPIHEKMRAELDNRFKYHAPKGDQTTRYQDLRAAGLRLAEQIVHTVPLGRDQALALTKLEEAIMHANAGIARGEP